MKSCFVITCICCASALLLHFCHSPHHISDILGVKGQSGELPTRFRRMRCSSSRAFRNTTARFSLPFGSWAVGIHRARGHRGRAHVKSMEAFWTTFPEARFARGGPTAPEPAWYRPLSRTHGYLGQDHRKRPETEAKFERLGNVKG